MKASEKTPLKTPTRILKYDPFQQSGDLENESMGGVQLLSSKRQAWKINAFHFTAGGFILLSVVAILLSLLSPPPEAVLPVMPSHRGDKPPTRKYPRNPIHVTPGNSIPMEGNYY